MGRRRAAGGRGKPQEDGAKEVSGSKRQAPAKTSGEARTGEKAKSGGGCLRAVFVVGFWTFMLGVVPVIFLFAPLLTPPMVQREADTMHGGRARSLGIHALWTEVQKERTDFCTEAGAPDLINCMVSVWRLTWSLATAPPMLDFYTTMPLQTWARRLTVDMLPGQENGITAASPLALDAKWVEGAVSETGWTRSQIALSVLNATAASSARLRPVGVSDRSCLARQLDKIPCMKEFEKVFGSPREPVVGSELCDQSTAEAQESVRSQVKAALWGLSRPTVLYVYGLQAVTDALATLPDVVPDDVPVTIVLVPARSYGRRWYSQTRGRAECDAVKFRKNYELMWGHFAWIVRPKPESRLPRPKGSNYVS
eukprot:TRINITY_DN44131_c0_g1_i1.p1 TRINITY_DN44131_c0_g1~~TRINITY_DN44131_c0_g1_i1.p1  ORF type:complete len:367 (+),score=74.14 TRINITY_DN44131_c0_g1_i1:66-1166(+)